MSVWKILNRVRRPGWLACLALGLLALAPGAASADFYDFNLTAGNTAISGYTGPYASVHVLLTDSTHATITFTSNTVDGNIYLMGGGNSGAVGLNINATAW